MRSILRADDVQHVRRPVRVRARLDDGVRAGERPLRLLERRRDAPRREAAFGEAPRPDPESRGRRRTARNRFSNLRVSRLLQRRRDARAERVVERLGEVAADARTRVLHEEDALHRGERVRVLGERSRDSRGAAAGAFIVPADVHDAVPVAPQVRARGGDDRARADEFAAPPDDARGCAEVALDRDVRVEGGARRVREPARGRRRRRGVVRGEPLALERASARAVSLVLPARRAVPQRRVRVRARGAVEARLALHVKLTQRAARGDVHGRGVERAGGRADDAQARHSGVRGVGRDGVRVPGEPSARFRHRGGGRGARPRGGRWGGGGGEASERAAPRRKLLRRADRPSPIASLSASQTGARLMTEIISCCGAAADCSRIRRPASSRRPFRVARALARPRRPRDAPPTGVHPRRRRRALDARRGAPGPRARLAAAPLRRSHGGASRDVA